MIIHIKDTLPENYKLLDKEYQREIKKATTPQITIDFEEEGEKRIDEGDDAASLNPELGKLFAKLALSESQDPDAETQIFVVATRNMSKLIDLGYINKECEFCRARIATHYCANGTGVLFSMCDDCSINESFVCAWCDKTFLPNAEKERITDILNGSQLTYYLCRACYESTMLIECGACHGENTAKIVAFDHRALCKVCFSSLYKK